MTNTMRVIKSEGFARPFWRIVDENGKTAQNKLGGNRYFKSEKAAKAAAKKLGG